MFKDPQIWSLQSGTRGSLWITILFGMIALPVGIFLPLGMALLMNNRHLKGQMAFRSMFYMPYIIPFVAAIFLWGGMLNPETGWINRALMALGMLTIAFNGDPNAQADLTVEQFSDLVQQVPVAKPRLA